jgi:plastocyanin
MNDANFTTSSITINAGQAVKFDNSSGSVHLLCLGNHQTCDTSIKDGPPALSVASGHEVQFAAGSNQSITFPNKGDFHVTCTVHSNMDMIVHVL